MFMHCNTVNMNQDDQIMHDKHILSCEMVGLTRATAAITLFCAVDQTDDMVAITSSQVIVLFWFYWSIMAPHCCSSRPMPWSLLASELQSRMWIDWGTVPYIPTINSVDCPGQSNQLLVDLVRLSSPQTLEIILQGCLPLLPLWLGLSVAINILSLLLSGHNISKQDCMHWAMFIHCNPQSCMIKLTSSIARCLNLWFLSLHSNSKLSWHWSLRSWFHSIG